MAKGSIYRVIRILSEQEPFTFMYKSILVPREFMYIFLEYTGIIVYSGLK